MSNKPKLAKLEKVFNPDSVAIIGASHDPKKLGYIVFENFVRGNFGGRVYAVNPNAEYILGKEVYASVKKIPDDVELAVVVIPANAVQKVVSECIDKGIPNVIVISGGFSEIGGSGTALEDKLKKVIGAAKGKTRLIGPNCVGVFDSKTKVDTLFLSRDRLKRPNEGNITFISQSGAVGSTVLDWLAQEGIGVSKFVSYGNGIDLNEADFLEFFAEDKDTRVIAMYLEGIRSGGKKFMEAMRNASSKKPVVILKAGKTGKGTKAVASHTGSLAGSARIYSGAFKQSHVTEALNWEELFDFAKIFSMQPLPKGNKLAIVTDGGGFGVLATDEAERQQLQLPEPTKNLKKKMEANMPARVVLHNPIDLTGDADVERYRHSMEAVLGSREYDGMVVICLMQIPTLDPKIVDAIVEMKKFGKPILVCAVGSDYTQRVAKNLENNGIPVFSTPERAVRAFATLFNYKKELFSK